MDKPRLRPTAIQKLSLSKSKPNFEDGSASSQRPAPFDETASKRALLQTSVVDSSKTFKLCLLLKEFQTLCFAASGSDGMELLDANFHQFSVFVTVESEMLSK